MKICIVTVYNSINSGSYWQAKALEIKLKKMGHKVVFLKRNEKNSSASFKYTLEQVIKKFLKHGIKSAKNQMKIFNEFKNSQKNFIEINKNDNDFFNIDYFVLGSDTIWNLESRYFKENYKTYFGGNLGNNNVITYAASVGNSKIEMFMEYDDIPRMLMDLKKVSVRDEESFNIVKKIADIDAEIVCDPTMLISKEEYIEIEQKPKEEKKYIFLYLFSKLSIKHQEELINFAKKNNLKIISGTTNLEYADECIINSPNNFLNYMLYADYVITDTFHGTIFSINLEKDFLVINRDKKKVNDAMRRFGLIDKIIDEENNIEDVFKDKIHFDKVKEKLFCFREKSERYLSENLK